MPYVIDWYIENEIIYTYYSGIVTIEELRESLEIGNNMIENSPRLMIHSITDVGDVTQPLKPQKSLEVMREVGVHERTGWSIILREKSLLMKIGIAFGTSVFNMRNRTFDTLEDTEAFLKDKDESLSWDKVNRSIIVNS